MLKDVVQESVIDLNVKVDQIAGLMHHISRDLEACIEEGNEAAGVRAYDLCGVVEEITANLAELIVKLDHATLKETA